MLRSRIAIALIAAALALSAHAAEKKSRGVPSTPIESDAVINHNRMSMTQINAMAALVRLHGYRCDSISAAQPMIFSHGYTLVCNSFRYSYDLRDRGGNWVVKLD